MKVKATSERRTFPFRITYFDAKGKFVSEVIELWEVRSARNRPNMEDAMRKLRGLRNAGGQEGMPGGVDEGWPGVILLRCGKEKPAILLPE